MTQISRRSNIQAADAQKLMPLLLQEDASRAKV